MPLSSELITGTSSTGATLKLGLNLDKMLSTSNSSCTSCTVKFNVKRPHIGISKELKYK